jgi:hypothetical protein
MDNYELFNQPDKKKVKAFNASVNFCETAKDLTREDLEQSDANLELVINELKKQLSNNDC